jgi:hypothetical protein
MGNFERAAQEVDYRAHRSLRCRPSSVIRVRASQGLREYCQRSQDRQIRSDQAVNLWRGRKRCNFNSDKWFREFTGTKAEARAFVISANLHRRHLSAQKKRELIALLLKANAERSDRAIAADVHVDHKTVAAVRHEGESSGDFPRFEKRTGADGKERKQPTLKLLPSPAPKSKPKAPAPSKATKPASLARDEEIVALVSMLHRHWVDIPALLAEAIPVAKRVAFVQSVAGKLGVSVTINGTLQ